MPYKGNQTFATKTQGFLLPKTKGFGGVVKYGPVKLFETKCLRTKVYTLGL